MGTRTQDNAKAGTTTKMNSSRVAALLPVVANLVISIGLYFVLRWWGFSEIWSLAIPGIAAGAITLVNSIRARRLDTIGVLVIVEIAVSLGLAFTTDDPRIAAIRPAFYTLVTGGYFLFTCVVGRPMMYTLATPMATDGGEPVRTRAYELAWQQLPQFRRGERIMTLAIGLVLFLDSAIRIAVVYSYPADDLDRAFLISQVAGIVMIVLVLAIMVAFVKRLSVQVDRMLDQARSDVEQAG